MKYNSKPLEGQLELFPIAPYLARDEKAAKADKRPAPIQTADKFNFPLQHYAPVEEGQEYQYSILDWIAGLTSSGNIKASRIWSDMQNQTSISIVSLDYVASDGKTYKRDYTNAKGLYLISQNLRATKARPQLKEVREFLATSAAWVELVARDEKAAKAAIKGIAKHHDWRVEGIEKRKLFTQVAKETHINGKPRYDILTNAIYHRIGQTVKETTAKREICAILNLSDRQAKNFRDHITPLMSSAVKMAEEAATTKMYNANRLLSTDEQLAIVRQCARIVAASAYQLAEYAGIDLVTGIPVLPKERKQ